MTYKNQITLPKKIVEKFGRTEYFEATVEEDAIVLQPVKIMTVKKSRLDSIRRKIAVLGITEQDVNQAIEWVRKV